MKEFMYAALPWLFMGLALAVVVVSFVDARKRIVKKLLVKRLLLVRGLGLS